MGQNSTKTTARKGMLNLLNRFFKDITVAVNGEDGLEKFKSKTHDLIISDINMPKMSGLDMIKIIREDNLSIPVLLLSAHDESSFFLNAIKLDVDGYILKPIEYKQLLNEVSKIVRKINLLALESNYKNTLEAEVKSRNSEILYKLNHDPLTKLLSRHAFFRNIEGLSSSVILLIDIDKFNVINEVYGTDIGSKVLQKLANYLQHHTDETCLVHRLSADEFALVDTAKYIDTDKYELLIERLFKNLDNLKIQVDEHAITIDITIGLSAGKASYENAKIALDYAKKYKKNFIMYSTEIDHRNESKITLACRNDISAKNGANRTLMPIEFGHSCRF